jgi:polysaccharide pyruvyl transferase WcaK-like protein
MEPGKTSKMSFALFGHFDSSNFSNECTLQAMIYNIRRRHPNAKLICISTGPAKTAATHHIEAIAVSEPLLRFWVPRSRSSRVLRKLFMSLIGEPYRWIIGLLTLKRFDMLIIPGTGLITGAYGYLNWGPYTLLKWCIIAKICCCKISFVSIGAGPIHTSLGRRLIKAALRLSDFRSYRDVTSIKYLNSVGFHTGLDLVYPDLAFSLPIPVENLQYFEQKTRKVIGLGAMASAGTYGTSRQDGTSGYSQQLAIFAAWLLENDYDVRLLIGDISDVDVKRELMGFVKGELSRLGRSIDPSRIMDDPTISVEDLLSQIAATDIVVATRFHNVLLAVLCGKPVLSISFHHKCESLMRAVDLSDYCVDINDLKSDKLIEKFCELERNAEEVKLLVAEKVKVFREALDEQYRLIVKHM